MNKKNFMILFTLLMLVSISVSAQQLTVLHVAGKVTATVGGKSKVLKMSDNVTLQTVINVPYEASIDFVDTKANKRYVIKTVGKGTVASLSANKGNTASVVTARYVNYVKRQVTNKEAIVSAQRYSDFATVTREVIEKSNRPKTQREIYDEFKEQARETYNKFRLECQRKYTDFVRQAWAEYKGEPAEELPNDQKVKPVVYDEEAQTNRIFHFGFIKKFFSSKKKAKEVKAVDLDQQVEKKTTYSDASDNNEVVASSDLVQPEEVIKNQPKPIEEIKEVEVPAKDRPYQYMPFNFLGKELVVRIDETRRVNMGNITPDRVADILERYGSIGYDNLLYDCLELRDSLNLCDWAYLLMLKSLTDTYCGPDTNEGILLMGYLYYQSGYRIRFAHQNREKLFLLVGTKHRVLRRPSYIIDGITYYSADDLPDQLAICPAQFEKEKELSLFIPKQMKLDIASTESRNIVGTCYNALDLNVCSNKNLIDFYNTYPMSYVNNNVLTRWTMLANTPMAENVRQQIYPEIKKNLEGLSDVHAVNRLMNLFHRGFVYKYDEEIWGYDRAFFAEETLFYPYCDCEDRAILLTRIVRDILKLKCVLVYYPGHLACAIHFNEEVEGDTYYLDGVPYTVADPTYIGASVGEEMPLPNNTPTLIKLDM